MVSFAPFALFALPFFPSTKKKRKRVEASAARQPDEGRHLDQTARQRDSETEESLKMSFGSPGGRAVNIKPTPCVTQLSLTVD